MSNKDNEYKSSSLWQLILVIAGTILAFTLLIALLAKSFSGATPEAVDTAAVAKVEANIKPVAQVEVASAAAGPHVDKSGEEVVAAVCSACHAGGLMNSPKIGDKDAWKPRIAQGYDTLVHNAINGVRTIPAKGGNSSLSDTEVTNAVVHMANLAGADFKAVASKATEVAPAVEAAPAAVAAVTDTAAPAAGKSGEEVYKAVCAMCHGTGLMNAPKFGDKGQWEPRIAQGYDTLVKNAVNGIRTMPAKGGNASLSDTEVAGAVKYMANEAGAGF